MFSFIGWMMHQKNVVFFIIYTSGLPYLIERKVHTDGLVVSLDLEMGEVNHRKCWVSWAFEKVILQRLNGVEMSLKVGLMFGILQKAVLSVRIYREQEQKLFHVFQYLFSRAPTTELLISLATTQHCCQAETREKSK